MELEEGLINLGFSPRKAKVLAVLMGSKPLSVDELVDLTGISRPHLYTILRELIGQGFVLKVESKPSRYTVTTDRRIFEELVEDRIRYFKVFLKNIVSKVASTKIRGTFYFADGFSLKREFERILEACRIRIWVYVPSFSLLNKRAIRMFGHAAGLGIDVRIATSDEVFINSPTGPPSYIRYIEPVRPMLLGILDSNAVFGYMVKMKVVGGFISNEKDVLKDYVIMFEHIWIDDYAETLYRVKARVLKPY
ncbi:MAG: hypothetical protein DRJ38_05855 [Thermoprotei archaeon]|nr:MAG: hypothetical protein DRJ38_05855 [Thermoprotei archaeon]